MEAADPQAAQQEVLDLARETLPGLDATAYQKYYLDNPLGRATLLLTRGQPGGSPTGMVALFPWQLLMGGDLVSGGLVGGFAVTPEYRGLGPALSLQRAVLASARDAGMQFTFGAPNQAALPVFRRLRYSFGAPFIRLVRPMSIELASLVDARLRVHPRLRAALDPALLTLAPERWRDRRVRGQLDSIDRFDETYRAVWDAVSRRHLLCGPRNPQLLNWRFEFDGASSASERRFAGLVLRRGRPVAYAVWFTLDRIRHVVDIAASSVRDLRRLIAEVLIDARRTDDLAVSVAMSGRDDVASPALRGMGFLTWQEQLVSVLQWTADGSPPVDMATDRSFLVAADVDV
jgi:GNAT superfamily N-acetyltransferase